MSGFRVLVACSDLERRAALNAILAECGLEPATAAHMEELRTVLARGPVHVVFCEDCLPNGGFREVLRLTKATGAKAMVVVCSLLGELDEYLDAMELGAFDFIAPPYRRTEVESIVNSVQQNFAPERMRGIHSRVQDETPSPQGRAVA